jgi:concanavalin A-like lectin/glucanase superfamily protein
MKMHTRRDLLRMIGAAGVASIIGRPALAASARPYHVRVLEKGPVGYWRFEEQSGLVAHDSSGRRRDGTCKGGVMWGQHGAIQSESDGAIDLNGAGAFVEIPDSTVFSQPTSGQGLTVEAWMRPDALTFEGQTAQRYIHWLGKGESGAFEWGFRFYSKDSPTRPNRISAYIWNASGPPGTSNEGAGAYFQDELTQGEWIHVVACYGPGDASDPAAGVSIYKNGLLRASPLKSRGARYASYDIHAAHGGAPLRLGTRDLGSFLHGGLDEVAIYPRVLSADEVADNFSAAARST